MSSEVDNLGWEDLLLEFMRNLQNSERIFEIIVKTEDNDLINFFIYTLENLKNIEQFEEIEKFADYLAGEFSKKDEMKKALVIKVFGYFPYYANSENIDLHSVIFGKLESAIFFLEELKAKPVKADFLNCLAILNYQHKNYQEANAFYSKSITIYRELTEQHINSLDYKSDLAMGLQNLATLFLEIKEYKKAEKTYIEAIQLYRILVKIYPVDFGNDLAMSLQNLAHLFSLQNRYEEAEKLFREAIKIRKKLTDKNPKEFESYLARSLQNFANLLSKKQKFEEAEKLYRDVVRIYEKLVKKGFIDFEYDLATSLQNLALFLFDMSEYEESEKLYREAIVLYKKLIDKQANIFEQYLALTLRNLALLFYKNQRYIEAETLFKESIELYHKLSKEHPKIFRVELAISLRGLATLFHEISEYTETEKLLKESITIYRELSKNSSEIFIDNDLAMSLQNLAILLKNIEKYEEAELLSREAIEIYKKLSQKSPKIYEKNLATNLQNLALLLSKMKKYKESKDLYEKSIAMYKNMKNQELELAMSLSNMALFFYRLEDYQQAKISYQEAIFYFEQSRNNIFSFREKLNFAKKFHMSYEGLIKTLIELKEYQEALSIAESAKSRAIGETISNHIFSSKIPKELTNNFKNLQNENYYLIEALNKKGCSNRGWLEEEYNKKRIELYDLKKEILEIDTNFLPNIKPLKFEDIREVIKKSQKSFVYFYVTDNGTFISIFYPNGELEYLNISHFNRDYLDDIFIIKWLDSYYNKGLDDFKIVSNKILNRLYEELLKEVTEKLKAKNIKDIVFIPNKALSLLPLHSCWYPKSGIKKYLIDEFNISYAPSITIYGALQNREKKLTESFSSFNMVNPKKDLWFSGLEILKTQNFTKNSNNLWHKKAIIKELLDSQSEIIHLSCHGSYNIDTPLDSSFSFSDKDLTLKEIINSVNLENNYLTILSACETGMIDFKEQSDEYLGLSIGFLMAKSPTVWGTLWSVDDFSTSLILIKAYEELLVNKKSKSEALNKAQIWVRDLRVEELVKVLEGYINEIEEKKEEYLQINSGLSSREFDDYLMYWDGALYKFKELDSDKQIFEHPYYWAGFSCVGIS